MLSSVNSSHGIRPRSDSVIVDPEKPLRRPAGIREKQNRARQAAPKEVALVSQRLITRFMIGASRA